VPDARSSTGSSAHPHFDSPEASDASTTAPQGQTRPFHVLLVDHEPDVRKIMARCTRDLGEGTIQLEEAASFEQARRVLASQTVDLVLVEPALTDDTQTGMQFARELTAGYPQTQTVLLTATPDLQNAIEAIRAGISDLIVKPFNLRQLNERVQEAIVRHESHRKHERRVRKLRKICQRLNHAREEISQQVDILCNDLVGAYQDLAEQMQQVVQTQEFTLKIKDELNLENLLRTTLEYLLDKLGPINAAVFLPSEADQDYALGGYVNYSLGDDAGDMLLQHLADVLSPRVAEAPEPVLIRDDEALMAWAGDDFAYLAECDILAFACPHEDQTLAVVVLFRDREEPIEDAHHEMAGQIAGLIGEQLAKIIRIHHRHLGGAEFSADVYGPSDASTDHLLYKEWSPEDEAPDPFDEEESDEDDGLPM